MRASGSRLLPLTVAALGIVFGDLGTSPLYALQDAFVGPHRVEVSAANIFGVVSLFIWALILVVTVKYLAFIMKADNRGEGGILALLALIGVRRGQLWPVALALFGTALLYGDGVITPAISVLSAVEGLEIASPVFKPFVVPATLLILVGLFAVQRQGSGRVGRFFGPVLGLWFVTIAALGVRAIGQRPEVLWALSPQYAVGYFAQHGLAGLPVLGAVVLCITGGEALYADMGHFGARPIRIAWLALVLPALILSYLGQGAVLLQNPGAAARPFYSTVPSALLYPVVVLATVATVIASQALISAVFSLTRQAVQLGYWPRVQVVHTSASEEGQVYVPGFNWALMLSTLALVLGFGSSTRLAAAYGLAVAGTMAITTILFAWMVRQRWGWPLWRAGAFLAVFLTTDLAFVAANLLKFVEGGWLPLVIGGALFTLMTIWARGRRHLRGQVEARALAPAEFLVSLQQSSLTRVPGTAVFLNASPDVTPPALLHYLKHAKSLHQQVVLLTVQTEEVPQVATEDRFALEELSLGFWRLVGRYGFMEDPNVPDLIRQAQGQGLTVPGRVTYFLGRETIIPSPAGEWSGWGERLFAFMHRNARPAADFFRLPPNQVMEVGAQVEL